jgi:2-polyprenyl-3-methyl-5-hydroxy-6-metoxy-1,4-benzoquinol methylase
MAQTTVDSIFNVSSFEKMDVYLLDQILKGRVHKNLNILDAGCGSGRNSIPLLQSGFQVACIDPKQQDFGVFQDQFTNSSIEEYQSDESFDFIICNAVLHFSENHQHFNKLIQKLISLLDLNGILFIRMTSDIGIFTQKEASDGVFMLKDGSTRYLVTRSQITSMCNEYKLSLIEPVKTTLVEDLRAMTTIVLKKN